MQGSVASFGRPMASALVVHLIVVGTAATVAAKRLQMQSVALTESKGPVQPNGFSAGF
jgi:hypothetical protein